MKIINKKYFINAPVRKVWDALVNPKLIKEWSGSNAEMSDQEGEGFKLWNGDIFGKNIQIVKHEKLVQEWSEKEWKTPSHLTFTLHPKNNGTQLVLVHENVPDSEFKSINNGWDEYYLGPLKNLVENS